MANKPTYEELCSTIDALLCGIRTYQYEQHSITLDAFFASDNLKEITDNAAIVLKFARQ
jgi:hypothetical protein